MSNLVQLKNNSHNKVFIEGHTKKIKDVMIRIKSDFIYIGYLLWEIREYKYFEYYGYKNVTEYGEKELLLEQSYISRLIKLCENYSSRVRDSEYPSMKLSDTYKSYSEWQLVAMLSIPKEKHVEVNPDMSVKDIRKFSKQLKEKNVTSHNLENSKVECKTLICSNCGEHYPVDSENKKQWIVINNKHVFQCCFQIKWDVDLLKKD